MRFDVHVFLHGLDDSKLDTLIAKVTTMALDLTKLQAAVTAEDTQIGQAVAALNGIPGVVSAAVTAALAAAGVDNTTAQATIDSITADVTAQTSAIAAGLTGAAPVVPAA